MAKPRGPVAGDHTTLPADDMPYWFRDGQPLAGFQSAPRLPESADVVVIGAGLTGAATAYHLARGVETPPGGVVVLDQGDPAGEASGRNGGNFELIPENSVGAYEGLARERLAFLQRVYPKLPVEVLRAESERQASLVLGVALRNRDLLRGIIQRERIECDFSPRGWLHLASTDAEEQGICEELALAAQHGQRIELWSRGKIKREIGIENAYLGRFIPGDGTYHPFKYVNGLLAVALAHGVQLHTRTAVERIESGADDQHRVVTVRGTIVARHVVIATNAFTSRLLPELANIRPHQSQIQVTEDAPDRARGRVITSEAGPVFWNQPRGGVRKGRAPVLMGGGADRPMANPSSRRRSIKMHRALLAIRDRYFPELRGRAPSAEWVGPLAFTPDELPAIGFLRPGLIIAAGFNGYGGSYTTAAGFAAAEMTRTGQAPEWVPEDVFSPRRLMTRTPVFMSERDGLWRIAASLCRQLKLVNQRISEALTLLAEPPASVQVRSSRMMMAIAESEPASGVPPEALGAFPLFREFTPAELRILLASMRRWQLRKGTLLFAEGSPGDSCFVVLSGIVDVSLAVNDRHQLVARLGAGNVFGQVSLIVSEPRSATCTIGKDAVLVELERAECERLLERKSPLALKLLGALNDGLIAALRGADRRRIKLEYEDDVEPAVMP